MRINFLFVSLLVLGTIFIVGGVNIIFAQNPFNEITYPITELGNCGSRQECKTFCDNSENRITCIEWGRRTKVFKTEDANKMTKREEFKKNVESFKDSPGKCATPTECDAYCRVQEHLDECLDHSVKYGYTSQEEAQKIREKTKRGGPGGCNSKESCDAYCKNPERINECLSFAVKEGDISEGDAKFLSEQTMRRVESGGKPPSTGPEQKIDKQKVESILNTEKGPGGCSTMQECGEFCMNPDHSQECIAFAMKHQIAPPKDLERMKKLSSMAGPGGCRGQKECETYCSEEKHTDECIQFSKENGLIPEEEIQRIEKEREIVKKMEMKGQSGPGGCKNSSDCNKYCSDSAHVEECAQFGAKTGLLEKDIVERMMGQTREARQKIMEIEREEIDFEGAWSDEMNLPPRDGKFDRTKIDGPQSETQGRFINRKEIVPQMPVIPFISPEKFDSLRDETQKNNPSFSPPPIEEIKRMMEKFGTSPSGEQNRYEKYAPPRNMMPQNNQTPPTNFIPPNGGNSSSGSTPPTFVYPPRGIGVPPAGTQQPPQGFQPPRDFIPSNNTPPEGFNTPPTEFTPPSNIQFPSGMQPPPSGTMQPPSMVQPPSGTQSLPPSSFITPLEKFFGSILDALEGVSW
ncbi:MAG: hypothetical protein WC897_06035 [Candidatus Gracilibacteria bacterium]